MCGIVGVLLARDHHFDRPLAALHRAAEQAQELFQNALASDVDIDALAAGMDALAALLDPLPGFASTFALGVRSDLRAAPASVLAALDLVRQAAEQARAERGMGLERLEQWNRIHVQALDLRWRLQQDLVHANQDLIESVPLPWTESQRRLIQCLWPLEYALRSIDRLEIRGRDSAGVAIVVGFDCPGDQDRFRRCVADVGLSDELARREALTGLVSGAIAGSRRAPVEHPAMAFVYKVASEIGAMGQNVLAIRQAVRSDRLLSMALAIDGAQANVMAHTRWASNGIINVFNAHPQGDDAAGDPAADCGLFAVLNGDIDNFPELLDGYVRRTGRKPDPGVTTDAKIIPLLVEERHKDGLSLREAFRRTLQEFRGSFAIALAHVSQPDSVLLGIGGSGQSLYVGLRDDALIYASELYGIVEATANYLKMDGERERVAGDPTTCGQIFELRRDRIGKPQAVSGWSFDGTSLPTMTTTTAQITTRDIDIAGYPHFFLKEIHESVPSVRKTLAYRFELDATLPGGFAFNLDASAVPPTIIDRLRTGQIRNIWFIGQGTAAIAAMGAAGYLQDLIADVPITVRATKATELSGHLAAADMRDSLIIAVSQSGTTTDTNRTVDVVRRRGAHILSIINRRNSDLVFKSDGVLYTGNGRDVEMSVASTKAFYCQIVAGNMLSLYLAHRAGWIGGHSVRAGLAQLSALPDQMSAIFAMEDKLRQAAERHAVRKRYWAVVGSGANLIAAHEIRIKLSELCYKSIACDLLEDKKHIDLSSEPLVVVCAAGLDESNLNDSVKEVAIFKAHRSVPIVIASSGADRFQPYAAEVFQVPEAPRQLCPILTTMVGHLFGYYAARALHSQTEPLRVLRQHVLGLLATGSAVQGNDGVQPLLAQGTAVIRMLREGSMDSALEVSTGAGLVNMLLELQQSMAGHAALVGAGHSPGELAGPLLDLLTRAIGELTRPIDAIKHQAKTVTVGISRPAPSLKGPIGQAIAEQGLDVTWISWRNLSFLQAAEALVARVTGTTLYHVEELQDGRPGDKTRIVKQRCAGIAETIASRTEADPTLRGTKWFVLKDGAVFIGSGRRDGRPIAILPLSRPDRSRAIILLLHLAFNDHAALADRLAMLRTRGPQLDRIVAAVTEHGLLWRDELLLDVPVAALFDESIEDTTRMLVARQQV